MTDLKNQAADRIEADFLFCSEAMDGAVKRLQALAAAEIISDMADDALCEKSEDGTVRITLAGILEITFKKESFVDNWPGELDRCSRQPLPVIRLLDSGE